MKVLVCGGRDYANREAVFNRLDLLLAEHPRLELTIIHGGASGADALAKEWAAMREVDQIEFRADWKRFGKAAGPYRNRLMLDKGKPDLVIAFPGGDGTKNMVGQAMLAGVECHVLSK